MTNAQKYFLVVAEELNISKSAKKLFISQQCLSAHIKRLEDDYGTPLFIRRPHLALTPAGDMLYNTLRQIGILENNLSNSMQEINRNESRVFCIGMHSWRAQVILPHVLPRLQKEYPNLKVKLYNDVTFNLEQSLIDGKLDVAVARARFMAPSIHTTELMDEPWYLTISDSMLKQYFPDSYPQCKEAFHAGVDIRDFAHVPFVMGLESSNSYTDAMEYFSVHGVSPKCILQTNVTEIHAGIIGVNYGAGFCPLTMIPLLHRKQYGEYMNLFPLKDWNFHNALQIAYLRNAYLPPYAKSFIALVQKYFHSLVGATPDQLLQDE